MTHTTSETGAQRERKRKRPSLPPTQGRMLRRLNELRRLLLFRIEHDVPLGDPGAWALVIAEVCLYHRDGCDLFTFREVEGHYVGISDDEALAAIHRVCRVFRWRGPAYRPMRPATVGKLLDGTMRAVDETPADAEAERKERDRERKLSKRAAATKRERERERERGRRRRAAQGARPRAQSLSRKRPWEARGVSRSTWYRQRDTKTSAPGRETKTTVRHLLRHREDGRICLTAIRGASLQRAERQRQEQRRARRAAAKTATDEGRDVRATSCHRDTASVARRAPSRGRLDRLERALG
jgi:hypothetical protein